MVWLSLSLLQIYTRPNLITLLNIFDTLSFLPPSGSSLLTPREVQHRHQEETVSSVCNTSQQIPPSDEAGNDAERTSCKVEAVVGGGNAINSGGVDVSGSEHKEGEPHGEEEGGKGDGGFQGEYPEEESKDEPALNGS